MWGPGVVEVKGWWGSRGMVGVLGWWGLGVVGSRDGSCLGVVGV